MFDIPSLIYYFAIKSKGGGLFMNKLRFLFNLSLFVILLPLCSNAEYLFPENIRIHDDPNLTQQSTSGRGSEALAYANNTIFSVWVDSYNTVYFAKSLDGGKSFRPSVEITNIPSVFGASVAVDLTGKYVYISYVAFRQGGPTEVYFARSTDSGESFDAEVRISANPYWDIGGFGMTVDSNGNVYISWSGQCYFCGGAVYIAKSTDNGVSFQNFFVGSAPWLVLANDVAVDEAGNIYVAWMNHEWWDASIINKG